MLHMFRGKRTDGKGWVVSASILALKSDGIPSYFIPSVNDKCITTEDDFGNILTVNEGTMYRVDPETIGRFTGQTDKNDKPIFEGDIWNCNGCIGVIVWVEEVSSFEAVYTMYGIEYSNAVTDIRAKTVEIIGNIHDNPELLEGGNNDAE